MCVTGPILYVTYIREEVVLKDIETHQRINDIFFGPLERPTLKWLAAHSPSWMTPDILTSIGFLGTIVVAGGYILTIIHPAFLWLASLGYLINWYGDSLDGTLARYRHIERPRYGFYLDHTIDAFSEIIIVLAMGISPFVRFDLACIALIGYLLMGNLVYINTCINGEFRISYGKLGPTEVRVIMIAANTVAFFSGNPMLGISKFSLSFFDWVVVVVAGLLFFFAIRSAIVNGISLASKGE